MDEFVENILKKWNLADLVERFRDEEVNEEAFLFLTPDIIKELIPKLGRRAIFIGRFNELKKSLQTNDDRSSLIDSPSHSSVGPKLSQPPTSVTPFSISEISTENHEHNNKQFEKYFLEQLTSIPSTNTPPGCVSIPNAARPDSSPSDTEDDPTAKRIKLEAIEVDEYGDDSQQEDNSQDSLSVLVENDRTLNRVMNDPDVPGVQKLRLLLSQSRLTQNMVNLSKLDKCQRTDLTNVVVHYIIARELGNNPTQGHKRETFNYWADAIVGLFPNERKMTFYSGMDGCTGKLHQRYLSVLRNKRNEDPLQDLGESSSLLNLDDFNVEPIQSRHVTLVTREEERAVDDVKRIVSSCFVMRDTRHSRTLSPYQRNILTANIVNYLMDKNGGPILNEELEYFAKAIEKIFPEENASIYFRRQGNQSRVYGKLFDRYGYMKRKRSLAQGKPYNDFLDSSSPIGQMWEMKTVEEARALWNETHKARKEVTRKVVPAKLFEKFPFLAQPDGYTLFVDDFNKDHPTAVGMFKQTWPEFATNIYRYIQENNFLLSVTEFSTDDYQKDISTSGLIILPLLFKLSVRNEKHWSPSRLEVSRNFILYATDFKEAHGLLKQRQELLEFWKLRINPVVIAIGPSISRIEECYIVVNEIFYKMKTVQKAVETCVKIYTALNLQYLDVVASPWLLVQRFVMKVALPKDNITTKVFGVLEALGRPMR